MNQYCREQAAVSSTCSSSTDGIFFWDSLAPQDGWKTSLFYFLNKSSLVISKWQCVIIMISAFELTDKCPQAIKIIWWNEHFEIPHLQIIATQQMLTTSRMRSKWKCTLCANYCWKIDIQIKLTFFLSFLKEFTVSS